MKFFLMLLLVLGFVISPAIAGQRSNRDSGRKDVHVGGYYRKNGTYVSNHYRASPGMGSRSYSSRSSSSRGYRSDESHPRTSCSPRQYHSSTSSTRSSHARNGRSAAARDSFMRQHPCPSTGKRSGGCPAYIVDHVRPLACGGADSAVNMQWQTVADAKAKDKTERIGCR